MPKFYRQNKKRRNPRYFLNEGMVNVDGYKWHDDNQSPDELIVSVDGEQVSVRQIFKELHERHEQWSGWMDNITDPEEQDRFMAGGNFMEAVKDWAEMNDHQMARDDFDDERSSMSRDDYKMTSAVMQDDDSIPLQKKIPSGYGTRGGKKSGQLEFPGLG